MHHPVCTCGWKGEPTTNVYKAVAQSLLHTQLELFSD